MTQNLENLAKLIEITPHFPEKWVKFRDISPLLAQKYPETIEDFAKLFDSDQIAQIDAFAGIDSRGFIFASALAAHFGKNLVLIRKAGKLPPPLERIDVTLEYGTATFEMKTGSGRVIIVDDVLATGGSMTAAADLCVKAGYTVHGLAALIDLPYLNDFSWNGLRVKTLFQFEA